MKNKNVINLSDAAVKEGGGGVKYSELLEQFMAPFQNEFRGYEYFEDIIEKAIAAWNLANVKAIALEEAIDGEIEKMPAVDDELKFLEKMIDYKIQHFKEYTRFIIDFEIDYIDGQDPVLRVMTQEPESYLANIGNLIASEPTDEDFQENYINRSAIVIRLKKPFVDYVNNLYPDDPIEELGEANIYLVDDEIEDLEKWLRKKFDKFFQMELLEWHENKKEWPQKRNFKMFKEWFDYDLSTMIYDLEKRPISKME